MTESVWISPSTDFSAIELDEIFWFTNRKERSENRSNCYIMTMLSRYPRQIVNFRVDKSVNKTALQDMVESTPIAKEYFTDGGMVYLDVDFQGKHRRNIRDKKDTHNIESSNADLRHHIAGLSRRKKCFFGTIETLEAVLSLFIDAYNKFEEMKMKHQQLVEHKSSSKHLHKYRYPTFSVLDFL